MIPVVLYWILVIMFGLNMVLTACGKSAPVPKAITLLTTGAILISMLAGARS